jgi:hypothetical protein
MIVRFSLASLRLRAFAFNKLRQAEQMADE